MKDRQEVKMGADRVNHPCLILYTANMSAGVPRENLSCGSSGRLRIDSTKIVHLRTSFLGDQSCRIRQMFA